MSVIISAVPRFAAVFALLLIALLLVPPAATTVRAAATCEATGPLPGEQRLPAEQRALLAVARQLPLDVKVGQVLMPGFVGTAPDAGLLDRARRGHAGGFYLLERNVRNADQVRNLLGQLSSAAAETSLGLRPFLATDFEGGIVNTLRLITGPTTSAAQMAAMGVAGVQARGAQDAAALQWLGFNTDLAPVADVLTVPSNVIGTRSFSSDAQAAAVLSRAYLRGLQGGGVLGVMKHFPGHGGTSGDSHVLLPRVDRSLDQLQAIDLLPYRQAFAVGEAQAVMVGHLLVPAVDPELPTSISPRAVDGLLRRQLGFDGLVMTDELKMGAISGQFGTGQAALMAINAGVDVILADYTGAEQDAVAQTLIRACSQGAFPIGRLEQSVARILRLKLAYGLAGPDVAARYNVALGLPAGSTSAAPAPDLGGVALPGLPGGVAGRFYADAGPRPADADPSAPIPFGYAITDENGIGLWSSYAALGGPSRLGYPISQRFQLDDAMVQITQRALLRWDPQHVSAEPANIFELFDRAGTLLGWPGCDAAQAPLPAQCRLDDWLAARGIPPSMPDDGSVGNAPGGNALGGSGSGGNEVGGDTRRAVATRLSWLDNDLIRAAFLADPAGGASAPWPSDDALAAGLAGTPDDAIPWAAIARYGLPMSRPQRYGPFLTQRFQRAALQLWLDDVPGMPAPGTVSAVPAGELFRDAGLVPAGALVSSTVDGAPGPAPDLSAAPQPPPPPAPPATPTAAPTPIPAATASPVPAQPTPAAAAATPSSPAPTPSAPPAATRAPTTSPTLSPTATSARR